MWYLNMQSEELELLQATLPQSADPRMVRSSFKTNKLIKLGGFRHVCMLT